MNWWIRIARLGLSLSTLFALLRWTALEQEPSLAQNNLAASPQTVGPNDRLGMVWVGSAEIAESNNGMPGYRFDRATNAGAVWDRWPMYWNDIEIINGYPVYTWQDATVNADVANGMQLDAVLVGTPSWVTMAPSTASPTAPAPRVGEGPHYMGPIGDWQPAAPTSPAAAPPKNLYNRIFTDGTDVPGPGKAVNQDNTTSNYWARFVYNTVTRYKDRVHVWEMWNEPDETFFWSGTVDDYLRLLKVGYIVAKFADPNSTVLMGGMAYWQQPTFFPTLLGKIKLDSGAVANNYFFDVTPWHWYNRSSQLFDKVNDTRTVLQSYGLGYKPIWVNETGVPIWSSRSYFGSATADEAASFVIQAVAYGFAAGLQRIFQFQEYDDGNAEIFGLMDNNNNARPSYSAFQVASRYLTHFTSAQATADGVVEKVVMCQSPSTKVTAIWDNSPNTRYYTLPATPGAKQAYWVDKYGNTTNMALNGSYSHWLPGATDNNGSTSTDYIIGGSPYLLVESSSLSPPAIRSATAPNGIYQLFFPQLYNESVSIC